MERAQTLRLCPMIDDLKFSLVRSFCGLFQVTKVRAENL